MSRRGNPYDNAKAESFMKTLKVEAVYLAEYDTYEDVAADLPRFIDEVYNARQATLRPGLSQPHPVRGPQRPHPCQNRRLILSNDRGALQYPAQVPDPARLGLEDFLCHEALRSGPANPRAGHLLRANLKSLSIGGL